MVGRAVDAVVGGHPQEDLCTYNNQTSDGEPYASLTMPGMCVAFKPVGWEMGGVAAGYEPLHPTMMRFLLGSCKSNACLDLALTVCDGCVYCTRLDMPSSGLVLAGLNLESLLFLSWSTLVYRLARSYVVMVNGKAAGASAGRNAELAPSP